MSRTTGSDSRAGRKPESSAEAKVLKQLERRIEELRRALEDEIARLEARVATLESA